MRGAGLLSGAVVVALAIWLGAGDLLAKQPTLVVPSLNPRPQLTHWQADAWEWLRASVTSTTFIAGLIVGVVFAEIGRFVVRWLLRAVGFAAGAVNFVVRYRLLAVGIAAAIYYVATNHILA